MPCLATALAVTAFMTACKSHQPDLQAGSAAERRAIQFLSREVPAWPAENHCFSCHNNGDAARALYLASATGLETPENTLATTTAWLAQPAGWDNNKGDPGFSDARLANLQFALATLAATEVGRFKDRHPLHSAARKVSRDQAADGSWPIDTANPVGSPTTYGHALATALAFRVLQAAALPELAGARDRAISWLRRVPIHNTPTAAAVVLAGSSTAQVRLGSELLVTTQNSDGGWGPYADAPSETYDTSLALLALAQAPSRDELGSAIRRGRRFLSASQASVGSWPATTRPPGGESYAQQMSTTAWATLALLATRELD